MISKIWKPVFAQIAIRNCIVRISDSIGHYIDVKIGEGNLTYSEKRNINYTLNRGLLDEVKLGDEVAIDISLDAVWEYISGGVSSSSMPSIEDVLKRRGAASNWVSTDPDTCRPYAVDITIIYTPSPAGCGDEEDISLLDFRYEEINHDLRAGTLSITGKCNVMQASSARYGGLNLFRNPTFISPDHDWSGGVAINNTYEVTYPTSTIAQIMSGGFWANGQLYRFNFTISGTNNQQLSIKLANGPNAFIPSDGRYSLVVQCGPIVTPVTLFRMWTLLLGGWTKIIFSNVSLNRIV